MRAVDISGDQITYYGATSNIVSVTELASLSKTICRALGTHVAIGQGSFEADSPELRCVTSSNPGRTVAFLFNATWSREGGGERKWVDEKDGLSTVLLFRRKKVSQGKVICVIATGMWRYILPLTSYNLP
jgi:hypothetical protein